ncbi:MAG TPA: hypothetical protein VII94_01545 [Candidatus Saccharimonadales bacterium]
MKIKELIAQLSTYDKETEVELMYSFHTLSVDNKDTNVRITEDNFMVVPHVGNVDKMTVNSILLATATSLIGD